PRASNVAWMDYSAMRDRGVSPLTLPLTRVPPSPRREEGWGERDLVSLVNRADGGELGGGDGELALSVAQLGLGFFALAAGKARGLIAQAAHGRVELPCLGFDRGAIERGDRHRVVGEDGAALGRHFGKA